MKKIFGIAALLIIIVSASYSQWSEQTSGINTPLTSVSAIDNNNAWICGYSGRVLRTTNGGTNWIAVTNPSAYHNFTIFGIDANTALIAYYNNNIPANLLMRTTNGGSNWTQVFSQNAQNNGSIDAIWMSSATNGFMVSDPVGGRWSLWKTTNGGVNWDSSGMYLAASQGNIFGCNNSLFVSGSNYYFGTNAGKIYYSSNSGLNWAAQILPFSNTVYAIWFNNPSTGLVGCDTAIFKTTNNGTWLLTPLPGADYVTGIVGDGTNFWMTRYANTIYKSTNNGATWTTDYTSNNSYMTIGKARTGNRMWAVSYSGTISKSDGLNAVTPVSNEMPSSFNLAQNYPNPFNPSTTISFSIPSASAVSIKVYDVLGNEVMTVVNESLQAGTYSTSVNMSNVSSGIYFYTIKAGSFIDRKKMILVK